MRRRVRLASLLCVGALAWSAEWAAESSVRLHMTDGKQMDAAACRLEGGLAILALPGGGKLAFPSSRVERIERFAAPQPPAVLRETPAVPEQPEAAAPAGSVDAIIRRAAERYHLEVDLLAAVIAVESGFRADAVSPKGAQGLMQLMPGTAKELSVSDPFDPAQNIDAGARYLRQLLDKHGDVWVRALAAYNAGSGRVAHWKGIPPYRETYAYIERVLSRYRSPLPPPPEPDRGGRSR